jgi:hypothetical protein
MTTLMTSIRTDIAAQYRLRAQEARSQAAATSDGEQRKRLLHYAEQWERMAEYEEKSRASR